MIHSLDGSAISYAHHVAAPSLATHFASSLLPATLPATIPAQLTSATLAQLDSAALNPTVVPAPVAPVAPAVIAAPAAIVPASA